MAMENRLDMKLQQKLVLTPQLQLAIKLLQMPQLELSQTLTNELIENPMLEEIADDFEDEVTEISDRDSADYDDNGAQPDSAKDSDNDYDSDSESLTDSSPDTPWDEGFSELDSSEKSLEMLVGTSVDSYFEERERNGRDLGYFGNDSNLQEAIEKTSARGDDLQEFLLEQLGFAKVSNDLKCISETVIGNIDENGYLRASFEEIAHACDTSPEMACKAVKLIQTFDPAGVGARDLSECLLIQLGLMHLSGSLAEKIVTANLSDLEKKNYKPLAARYSCSIEEIMNAVRVIESLEPKPGRNFSSPSTVYIVPDVYVVKTEDCYRIVLNDENIPNIRINGYYRKLLMTKNTLPKEEKQYIEDKFRSAVWLLKSLDHRNKTIYRVTESILEFQRDFFDKGVSSLKPLNLRDVADELQMHESTISRATSNKFLSCHHGLFSFRYFFCSGITGDSGPISSVSVKEIIKTLVSEEAQEKPLSDQSLVDILKQRNVTVARRTVAKYREELNIPPQAQRKKNKSIRGGRS